MLTSIDKILYATDLGANAAKVFNYAVSIARRFGGEIYLLHAIEPLGPTGRSLVRNVVPAETLAALERDGLKRLHDEIHRRLTDFAERNLGTSDEQATLVSHIVIEEGAPDQVIVAQAKSIGADLIILGTHSYDAVERVLIGSVARKVIHASKIPVLLVPIPQEA